MISFIWLHCIGDGVHLTPIGLSNRLRRKNNLYIQFIQKYKQNKNQYCSSIRAYRLLICFQSYRRI